MLTKGGLVVEWHVMEQLGSAIAKMTNVHCRPLQLIALAGSLVMLAASSASAQELTLSASGGPLELQFVAQSSSVASCPTEFADDNIVWGTAASSGQGCAAAQSDDNIVWGTALADDNIVWGTMVTDDNIVWGTALSDDNIVWGTDYTDDNIVWGTQASFGF